MLITIVELVLSGILAIKEPMPAQNVSYDMWMMKANEAMKAMEPHIQMEFERLAGVPMVSSTSSSDVMLITGGDSRSNRLSSVEIFDPSNPSLTCTLPDMTVARHEHAGVGMTMCGGAKGGRQSCEMFDGQQWVRSHSLLQEYRIGHVMWKSPNKGMMLMGGSCCYGKENTVETLLEDGSSVMQPWKMQYRTGYGHTTNIVSFKCCHMYCCSYACAIDLGQTVVITGGQWYTMREVTEYSEDGQHKELPQLVTERHSHGCSSYVDTDGNIVKTCINCQAKVQVQSQSLSRLCLLYYHYSTHHPPPPPP